MLYFQSGYECWCGDSYGRFGLCYIFSLVTNVGVVIPMAGLAHPSIVTQIVQATKTVELSAEEEIHSAYMTLVRN